MSSSLTQEGEERNLPASCLEIAFDFLFAVAADCCHARDRRGEGTGAGDGRNEMDP